MSLPPVRDRSPGLLVFALAAPVLSWLALEDIGFRDSGELGAAAFTLGVAHPTGFPGDLLALRAASFFPLGHIAWRQNLCVALQAAAALGVLAQLCAELARKLEPSDRSAARIGALVAAAGLLGWATFLASALAVEVYSLSLLCLAYLALAVVRERTRGILLASLLVGLGVGLHVTVAVYGALVLGCVLLNARERGVRALKMAVPLAVCGALLVLYLPLASAREPALDWGDPETIERLVQHLTAARIRTAYAGEMLRSQATGSAYVLSQFSELWPLAPLAVVGFVLGFSRWRMVVLAPAGLLCLDLAYASFVNPMGAVDRQVGHVAGAALCVLAGLGVSSLALRLRGAGRAALSLAAIGLAVWLALRAPAGERADGHAAAELFGSGGPLASVPPRTILLCRADDACSGGLFALLVEAVRPDIDVAPAQHLWDPTVLRSIEAVALPRSGYPAPSERAARAATTLRELALESQPRPVLFTSAEPLGEIGLSVSLSDTVPYLRALPAAAGAPTVHAAWERLERLRGARGWRFRSPRAQLAWSQAYGQLGELALEGDTQTAEAALRRAIELAPTRSAAWTNLGVLLQRLGQLPEAAEHYRRAIQLDRSRSTPWLNLARLQAHTSGPAAGLEVLDLARASGVADSQLENLEKSLRTELGRP